MKYSVVTIARTVGALGEDAGRMVADQLGFRYADDEIIATAAERAGVSKKAIEATEHRQGLIGRILDTMGSMPIDPQLYYGQALAMPSTPEVAAVSYDELIRDVIIETANRGKVVIVAHGAGICLGDREGVLRVLITASPDNRVARLVERAGVRAEEARKAVSNSDADRADFLKRFYDVKTELPTHYDIVINTDALTPQHAADLIVAAAGE